jgi:hypothetical protein
MRTHSPSQITPFDPAYTTTVGATAKRQQAWYGKQPIDPTKVARALLGLATNPEPPLHLILGTYELETINDHLHTLTQ